MAMTALFATPLGVLLKLRRTTEFLFCVTEGYWFMNCLPTLMLATGAERRRMGGSVR